MTIPNRVQGFLLCLVASTTSSTFAAEPVNLRETDWSGVRKTVAGNRGKLTAVMIWTTTCEGCKAEFPAFAAMGSRFGDDIALVSVCCDYDGIEGKPPKFYRPDALTFLKKQEAKFDNVMLTEAFIDFLDRVDLASTPAVFVYGKDGKLAKRFDHDGDASFGMKDVAKFVESKVGSVN